MSAREPEYGEEGFEEYGPNLIMEHTNSVPNIEFVRPEDIVPPSAGSLAFTNEGEGRSANLQPRRKFNSSHLPCVKQAALRR